MTYKELEEKATPLPWHTEGDGQIFGPNPEFDPTDLQTHDEILIADVAPENVALTEYDADNAAMIVHCVNHFGAVVEALEGVCEAYGCECLASEPQPHCPMCVGRKALDAAQHIPSGEKEEA